MAIDFDAIERDIEACRNGEIYGCALCSFLPRMEQMIADIKSLRAENANLADALDELVDAVASEYGANTVNWPGPFLMDAGDRALAIITKRKESDNGD